MSLPSLVGKDVHVPESSPPAPPFRRTKKKVGKKKASSECPPDTLIFPSGNHAQLIYLVGETAPFREFARKELKIIPGVDVAVEVGCSYGDCTNSLDKRTGGRATGFDCSSVSIQRAQERFPRLSKSRDGVRLHTADEQEGGARRTDTPTKTTENTTTGKEGCSRGGCGESVGKRVDESVDKSVAASPHQSAATPLILAIVAGAKLQQCDVLRPAGAAVVQAAAARASFGFLDIGGDRDAEAVLHVAETVLHAPRILVIKCRHLFKVGLAECTKKKTAMTVMAIKSGEGDDGGEAKPTATTSATAAVRTNGGFSAGEEEKAAGDLVDRSGRPSSSSTPSHVIRADDELASWWRELVHRVAVSVTGHGPAHGPGSDVANAGGGDGSADGSGASVVGSGGRSNDGGGSGDGGTFSDFKVQLKGAAGIGMPGWQRKQDKTRVKTDLSNHGANKEDEENISNKQREDKEDTKR